MIKLFSTHFSSPMALKMAIDNLTKDNREEAKELVLFMQQEKLIPSSKSDTPPPESKAPQKRSKKENILSFFSNGKEKNQIKSFCNQINNYMEKGYEDLSFIDVLCNSKESEYGNPLNVIKIEIQVQRHITDDILSSLDKGTKSEIKSELKKKINFYSKVLNSLIKEERYDLVIAVYRTFQELNINTLLNRCDLLKENGSPKDFSSSLDNIFGAKINIPQLKNGKTLLPISQVLSNLTLTSEAGDKAKEKKEEITTNQYNIMMTLIETKNQGRENVDTKENDLEITFNSKKEMTQAEKNEKYEIINTLLPKSS